MSLETVSISPQNSATWLPSDLGREKYSWFTVPWHIQQLERAIGKWLTSPDINRLIIQLPIRVGKSVWGSEIVPAWLMLNHPDAHIVHLSMSTAYTRTFGKSIRSSIQQFGPRYGIFLDRAMSQTHQFWLAAPHHGRYYGAGAPNGTTAGRGADYLICDDLVDNCESVRTQEQRDKLASWFYGEGLTRIYPTSKVLLIQSRRHSDDYVGRLLFSNPSLPDRDKWYTLKIPALNEKNESIWPERFSTQWYLDRKHELTIAGEEWQWETQYMQNARGDEGSLAFPERYFKDVLYKDLPPDLQPANNKIKRTIIAIDPSCGKNDREHDYTSIIKVVLDHKHHVWIDDAVLQRIPQGDIPSVVVNFAQRNQCDKFICEGNNFQRSVAIRIAEHLKKAGIMTDFGILETKETKKIKIHNVLGPMLVGGQVHIRDGPMWSKIGLQQFRNFPTGHDDFPDSIAIGVKDIISWVKGKQDPYIELFVA